MPQAPGLLQKILNAGCSVIPDAASVGGGFDFGLGFAFGGQGALVANGASGEASLAFTGTTSFGLIGPDAYAAGGFIFRAPTNSGLNTGNNPTPSLAVGIERVGLNISGNEVQATVGPALSPITVALQANATKVTATVPWVGYMLNLPRAACKLVTGH